MSQQIQDAYIVAATRTPIGRSHRGFFRNLRPDDLLVHASGTRYVWGFTDHCNWLQCAEVLADAELISDFKRSPAGIKQHHAHTGGLLDHVVNLLRLADRVAPLYPAMDRDMLLVGVLFHDIGKTVELESEKGFSYTDAGQLLGHVLLGLELLEEKIQAVQRRTGEPFEPELAIRLKHMIASHHGQYEFGSPKLPMTLEALALHHLDNLDARMAGVLQLLQNEASIDGGWTQYQQNLGRKFFRGRG